MRAEGRGGAGATISRIRPETTNNLLERAVTPCVSDMPRSSSLPPRASTYDAGDALRDNPRADGSTLWGLAIHHRTGLLVRAQELYANSFGGHVHASERLYPRRASEGAEVSPTRFARSAAPEAAQRRHRRTCGPKPSLAALQFCADARLATQRADFVHRSDEAAVAEARLMVEQAEAHERRTRRDALNVARRLAKQAAEAVEAALGALRVASCRRTAHGRGRERDHRAAAYGRETGEPGGATGDSGGKHRKNRCSMRAFVDVPFHRPAAGITATIDAEAAPGAAGVRPPSGPPPFPTMPPGAPPPPSMPPGFPPRPAMPPPDHRQGFHGPMMPPAADHRPSRLPPAPPGARPPPGAPPPGPRPPRCATGRSSTARRAVGSSIAAWSPPGARPPPGAPPGPRSPPGAPGARPRPARRRVLGRRLVRRRALIRRPARLALAPQRATGPRPPPGAPPSAHPHPPPAPQGVSRLRVFPPNPGMAGNHPRRGLCRRRRCNRRLNRHRHRRRNRRHACLCRAFSKRQTTRPTILATSSETWLTAPIQGARARP